jgi:hypothetical protein
MTDKKTLFILGAGASCEAKLPTGHELKKTIAELLDIHFNSYSESEGGDDKIRDALIINASQKQESVYSYFHAAKHIRDAMPQSMSIDNFIDMQRGDKKIELCGKLAIVRSILSAERNSLLFFDNSNIYNNINFENIEKTWYANLMKLLTENCTKENLSQRLSSISLIIFNYDRCFEHFLYNSLQNCYRLKPDEAGKLVNEIKIYHPYGVVGKLPWQNKQNNEPVEFGSKISPQELLSLSGQIKTFTEGTDPNSSEITAIQSNMSNAHIIVFLGFAYHKQNMHLLMTDSPREKSRKGTYCFGTAKGKSKNDCNMIKEDIGTFFGAITSKINILNELDCYGLFNEYWMHLSLC